MENGELIELIIEEKNKAFTVGSIYIGIIKKILPSQFAFIDIGDFGDTFLHITDKKERNIFDNNKLKIKCGQEIIVQVVKEGTEEKRPVVSSMITFSGKYIVLLFNDKGVSISKKIDNEEERDRLLSLGNKIISLSSEELGVIMRTNCVKTDENIIYDEAEELIEKYKNVVKTGIYTKAPAEIYRAENETEKVMRDLLKDDTDEIVINDISEYNNFISNYSGKGKVIFYDGTVPIFDNFFARKQIEKALYNKVWLKCGGFIVIDYAEACTVIDVNTGKYSGGNHRNTVFKTNSEAAKEIAKQLRLKNLSGIIIIDFIDMMCSEDTEKITEILKNEVKKDRVGVTVVGMTELGLMQLTRKKVRQPLSKALTCRCPACNGNGFIFNEYFIADKIKDEISSIFASTIYKKVVLESSKKIIDIFKGKNNEYKLIEEKFGGKIEFNAILTKNFNYYKLEKYKE
jgi:ribonuclease G